MTTSGHSIIAYGVPNYVPSTVLGLRDYIYLLLIKDGGEVTRLSHSVRSVKETKLVLAVLTSQMTDEQMKSSRANWKERDLYSVSNLNTEFQ